jgi:hypothetical protein
MVTNLVMAWNTHQSQATLNRWQMQGRQNDPQILHPITPDGIRGHQFWGHLGVSAGPLPSALAALDFTNAKRHERLNRLRLRLS